MLHARRPARSRALSAVLALAALGAAALTDAAPAAAQARAVYTVEGISVETTGESDLAAKESGVAQAKRRALRRLFDRITADGDANRLPSVEGDRLEFLIRDVTFDKEKFGGGNYIAELTIRFQRDAVQRLLRQADIPYAETASRRLVIVPVWRPGREAEAVLWGGRNPWHEAWLAAPAPEGLVPIAVPFGDLDDIAAIDAAAALAGDEEALDSLARVYGAGGAAVVTARPNPAGNGVRVTSTIRAEGWPSLPIAQTHPLGPAQGSAADKPADEAAGGEAASSAPDGGPAPERLLPAVEATIAALEDVWVRNHLLRFDRGATTITLDAPLNGLADYVALRRALEGAAPVESLALERMTVQEARFSVSFVGDVYQFENALVQAGLALEIAAGEWRVRRIAPDG